MVVEVNDIQKQFGSVQALRGIDLQVEERELFGVIGPDGAGKSTLFRILTTLLVPDRGTAGVLGLDVVEQWQELRPLLGYMPGRFSLYPDLSVRENLDFFASIFGVNPEDQYDLIRPAYRQLEPFESRRAADLSGGMKQKLALSCALVHRPSLLILDEPTTGVDAVSRNEFWQMLQKLKKEAITIIVATPYMDEAERCDRIALMQDGQMLQVGKPAGIAGSFDKTLIAVRTSDKYQALKCLRTVEGLRSVHPFGESIHVVTDSTSIGPDRLIAHLKSQGIAEVTAEVIDPSIEDRFMELMEQGAYASRY